MTHISDQKDVTVILSHTHGDHLDNIAVKHIPKSIPFFVKNNFDKNFLESQGFSNITIVGPSTQFNGITITKTEAKTWN